MTKSTRRKLRHTVKHSTEHVQTIPELRRAFEHIEQVGRELCGMSKAVPAFREEWKRTFYREISKQAAEAYMKHIKDDLKKDLKKRKTRRLRGGAALVGAPLDYTTRPGLYITPGGINEQSYAQVPRYVDSGFWNPEIAQQYDPVPQQTRYAMATPAGLGSNAYPAAFGRSVGGSKKQRRLRGGMASITSAFSTNTLAQMAQRMFPSTTPPNLGQDAITSFRGQQMGASPDPTQPSYHTASVLSRPSTVDISVSAIPVNLKRDISVN
jgi:hypothetical protein